MDFSIYYKTNKGILVQGDCRKVLRKMKSNVISAIVTDPPYGLGFMGKAWDSFPKKVYYEFALEWAKEALRVVKPGAFMLVFGGTRTYHRLTCAIEDAGWEIRDCLMWLYGSGFPKSKDISKVVDKLQGKKRKVVGKYVAPVSGRVMSTYQNWSDSNIKRGTQKRVIPNVTEPASAQGWEFLGYGTGLKPAWEPILVCMKPLDGMFAQNALKWGVAGLNVGAGRIGGGNRRRCGTSNKEHKNKTGLPPFSNTRQETHTNQGRWPANVILSHHPECVFIGSTKTSGKEGGYRYLGQQYKVEGFIKKCIPKAPSNYGGEKIDVWYCHPDCPVGMLDKQSGVLRGGASRFFYCAKASVREKTVIHSLVYKLKRDTPKRIRKKLKKYFECITIITGKELDKLPAKATRYYEVGNLNIHPTVKPINLIKYLCRLVAPPKSGVVLDMFMGSGTTALACEELGLRWVGVERKKSYCKVAKIRLKRCSRNKVETIF